VPVAFADDFVAGRAISCPVVNNTSFKLGDRNEICYRYFIPISQNNINIFLIPQVRDKSVFNNEN
jgi:hypothetical protein